MGARSKNFYNDLVKRMGYADAAGKIQDAFLAGRRQDAAAAVPDSLIDETALVGPPERITDRLQAWKEAASDHGIGTLLLGGASTQALRVIAEAVL
jgi:alkanesulfonate monooxygenase SsuD/methylene tetrahydromethanopterin reductase-like flavin-dependent oxidoreductase (luciferase family)